MTRFQAQDQATQLIKAAIAAGWQQSTGTGATFAKEVSAAIEALTDRLLEIDQKG